MWVEWMIRVLPALRRWVGREHQAFLRNVHVALPATHDFDSRALDSSSGLRAAEKEHLVSAGKLVVVPEHELIAQHYLKVLQVIQLSAKDYLSKFSTAEKRRAEQATRRKQWDSSKKKVADYDKRGLWHKFWNDRPSVPKGKRPEIAAPISNPAEWMDDLIKHPEQFDNVLILDAGGLSLDIAVVAKGKVVREISNSDTSCGGEELSCRVGRGQTGARGTRYKAQLGLRWHSTRDLNDSQQKEYRDATRELYGPILQELFGALTKQYWKGSRGAILLTGGGVRNPHMSEFVRDLADGGRLKANVVDAPLVQDLIRQVRAFPEPLSAINSDEIQRFEKTQDWSERREKQPLARYDKFAVVGGMLTDRRPS